MTAYETTVANIHKTMKILWMDEYLPIHPAYEVFWELADRLGDSSSVPTDPSVFYIRAAIHNLGLNHEEILLRCDDGMKAQPVFVKVGPELIELLERLNRLLRRDRDSHATNTDLWESDVDPLLDCFEALTKGKVNG